MWKNLNWMWQLKLELLVWMHALVWEAQLLDSLLKARIRRTRMALRIMKSCLILGDLWTYPQSQKRASRLELTVNKFRLSYFLSLNLCQRNKRRNSQISWSFLVSLSWLVLSRPPGPAAKLLFRRSLSSFTTLTLSAVMLCLVRSIARTCLSSWLSKLS
jgi:hypothetical protein